MKKIFLCLLALVGATAGWADNPEKPEKPADPVPIIIGKSEPSGQHAPRQPMMEIIGTYYYGTGVIELAFAPQPTEASIEVVNALQGVIWSGEVTPVGGYCQIEIGTDCAGENTIYIEIGNEIYRGAFLLDTL